MILTKTSKEVTVFKASRTFIKKPVMFTHFYYLDGILIDTGPPAIWKEVINILKNYRLEKVIITHQHEDHTGNCKHIYEHFNIKPLAHPQTVSLIKNPPPLQLYRQFLWGNPPPSPAETAPPEICNGTYQLQVIHTPGHTPDHISLFEPERKWLFCGDAYLGERLTEFLREEDILGQMQTLEKLISLKPRYLFCGLKGVCDQGEQKLYNKYIYLWNLGRQIIEHHRQGFSPPEIVKKTFSKESISYPLTQHHFGRLNLVNSVLKNKDYFTT